MNIIVFVSLERGLSQSLPLISKGMLLCVVSYAGRRRGSQVRGVSCKHV